MDDLKMKVISGIVFTLLLVGTLTLMFNIQPAKADYVWTKTIYIRADGDIEPADATVSTVDNVTYSLTDNIVGAAPSWFDIAIVVERDNIVLDGSGYTLQGTQARYSKGISVEGNNVTIKNTNIKGFGHGVYFNSTSYSTVSGNNITECDGNGIVLDDSSYNIISGNTVTGNDGTGAGIGLYGLLGTTINNTIFANNITKNYYGIYLDYSSTNSISRNNLSDNEYGIGLLEFSNNNAIFANNITNNEYGITLGYSSTNSIFVNNIKKNSKGITIWNNSSDNVVYHNNFINNTNQVVSGNLVNVWDNGYPSGGNYWSNYTGVDTNGDAIGDTFHVIDANNTDMYPFMAPFSTFDASVWNGTEYFVDVVSNSTVSDFYFNPDEGAFLRFNITGEDGTKGFCRVTIPKDLLWVQDGQWSVLVGGEPVNYTIIPDENYTYLYFTYNHSTKTVEIQGTDVIPEFPSNVLLLGFLVLITIPLIFAQKKRFKKAKT